jgi:diacylglycerol kinase family enzyme
VVAVLGGDGTLNEAANGLAGTGTALAALPGGSTNVFARTIGLPNDPIEATGVLLDALARRSIERVGLGSVNGRYFLFHTGVGFDAAVVEQVERRSGLKRYAGHPLFVYAGFDTWIRHYDRSRPRFAVHHADGSVIDDAYMTIVLNTSPYTFLGNRPLDLAPEATLERGLAAVTVRTMAFGRFLRIIGSALGSGRALRRSRWVDHRVDLSALSIQGYGPVPYQVDGDHLGDADRLDFRHEPEVMDLVLP